LKMKNHLNNYQNIETSFKRNLFGKATDFIYKRQNLQVYVTQLVQRYWLQIQLIFFYELLYFITVKIKNSRTFTNTTALILLIKIYSFC